MPSVKAALSVSLRVTVAIYSTMKAEEVLGLGHHNEFVLLTRNGEHAQGSPMEL
jgi:hypothetical protein